MKPAGVMGYPNGVDSSQCELGKQTWLAGAAPLAYAWESDSAVSGNNEEFNYQRSHFSSCSSFTFDTTNVRKQKLPPLQCD